MRKTYETEEKLTSEGTELRQPAAELEAPETERKQIEEALRESEEKYRTIFENVNDVVVRLDKRGKVIDANKRIEDYFGYKPNEIIGKNFIKLGALSPKDLPKIVKLFGERVEGKPLSFIELEVKRKDGSIAILEANTTLIKKDGKIEGTTAIIRDITERKAKEKDYQGIIQTTTDGFWIVDTKGHFLDVNDAYCALIGYSREELLNMSIPDIEAVETPEEVARRIQQIIKTGHARFETRHRCKSGRMVDIEISTTYAGVGDDRFFVFARDITERKQAEEALQAEKKKLQSVIDALEYGLTVQDRDYNILYQSGQLKKFFEDYLGEKCYRVYEGKDTICEGCPVKKAFKDGKSHSAVKKGATPSGEVFFLEHTACPIRDAEGEIVSCLEVTRNVTEREQAEEVLQAEKNKLQSVVDAIEYGLSIQDRDYNILYQSQPMVKVAGDHLGEKCYRAYEGKEKVCDGCPVEQAFRDGKSHTAERKVVTPSGKAVFLEHTASPIRNAKGEVVSCIEIPRNITQRKQMEEELRTSQEALRKIFESVTDGISVIDLNGIITEANQRTLEMHGFSSKDKVVGKSAFELVAPCDHERVAKNMRKALQQGTVRGVEYTLLKSGGSEFPGELSTSVLKDASGNPVGHVTISRDITERKQAEEELRQAKEQFQALAEESPLGVSMLRKDGRYQYLNPKFVEMFGYTLEDIPTGQEWFARAYPDPEYRSQVISNWVTDVNSSKRGEVGPQTYIVTCKDGSEKIIHFRPVVLETGDYFVIYEDITDRKQAEEREKELQQELLLSSRLASIGELAAGVAHQINNPLTGVLGFSQRLLRKSTDEEVSQDLKRIYTEAERAAKVVQNLLTFARRRESHKQYSDINEILHSALELRAYELKTSNIEAVTDLAPSLPQIMLDFHQIQEVFLNIILNAEQAMTEANSGGRLTIKTEEKKGYIRTTFTDDGPGIPAEHLDKIFDPFFSTRGEKGGTGLGLSVCHGIITEHGGRIYAKSKPGKGATFFVELPVNTSVGEKGG